MKNLKDTMLVYGNGCYCVEVEPQDKQKLAEILDIPAEDITYLSGCYCFNGDKKHNRFHYAVPNREKSYEPNSK